MLKKVFSVMAVLSILASSGVAQAATIIDINRTEDVMNYVTVSAEAFDSSRGETVEVSVNMNSASTINLLATNQATLTNYSIFEGRGVPRGRFDYTWNGKDKNGNFLPDGAYALKAEAWKTLSNGDVLFLDSASVSVKIGRQTGVENSGVVKNFRLDPSGTWYPSDYDLEVNFDLTAKVDFLTIEARKEGKLVEIFDDRNLRADDYSESWDGTDDDGDFVEPGTWDIYILTNNDTVHQAITVKYDDPQITEAFVSKDSIDVDQDEKTNLIFKVDEDAIVTVDMYKGSRKKFNILDEEDVDKNKWYAVEWDGTDDDGNTVDDGTDWQFVITAESPTHENLKDTKNVRIDVEEDDVASNRANVTEDQVYPIIFDDNEDSSITISYCIDDDADVYLAVYEGTSTGGSAKIELLDYAAQGSGCHTVEWDATDKNGKNLKDAVYSYKVISRTSGSRKDTETGKFVIGNAGGISSDSDDNDDDYIRPTTYTCSDFYSDLRNVGGKMCDAIGWATEAGIFNGNPDGSFRPYNAINRIETVKIILEAYNVGLLSASGSTLGFRDIGAYEWYMPYVRTANFYGMLTGYPDKTLRLTNTVNRAEMLKLAMEAGTSFTGTNISGGYSSYADVDYASWYGRYLGAASQYGLFSGGNYFYPDRAVQRGEAAVMLYRMHEAGLL